VPFIVLLPSVLYGLHLSIQGEPLLLAISILSCILLLVPRLGFFADKPLDLVQDFEKELGVVYEKDNQVYVLPNGSETGDFALEGEFDHCRRFFAHLFTTTKEELWWVSKKQASFECFESFDPSTAEERESFIQAIHRRAKVSYPFTVAVDAESASDFIEGLPTHRHAAFRLVFIGGRHALAKSQLQVRVEQNALIAEGIVADQKVELCVIDQSLTGEPGNDFRDEGFSTGEILHSVRQSSRKHGSTGRNESKRFHLPFRGGMIDQAERRSRGVSIQQKVSQNLSSQMGSPDSITDIATRLRDLGHGI
jgi:hypothetical protein